MRNATAAWGEEAWWPSAVELTGLGDASSLRKAWTQFIKLQRFQPGAIIFHPSGWGTGEITKLADNDTVVHVRFQSGRKDFSTSSSRSKLRTCARATSPTPTAS